MWQPNKLEQERLEKIQRLEALGIQPYPPRVQRTHTALQAIAAQELYEAQHPDAETAPPAPTVIVCGRIRRVNLTGKVSFMHIEDEGGRVQLFLRVNDLGEQVYNLIKEKLIDTDDFVQASGTMMRTKAGEISVRVSEFILIAKWKSVV